MTSKIKLKMLQKQFSESLFYQHDALIKNIKSNQGINAKQRLQVYRNSFIMGITEALSITFQHTLALVGEDFFNTICREFILTSPPHENNIITYGKGFSDYLEPLPQLVALPYVSEMARFEWLLEQTTNLAISNEQLEVTKLSQVSEKNLQNLQFFIPSQVSLFSSAQNIHVLYQMLLSDNITETDLNDGCYLALKKHPDFCVELITLEKNEFLLLQQIVAGQRLGSIKPDKLHQYLPNLLQKRLLNGFIILDLNNKDK